MDEFVRRLAAAMKQDFGGFLGASDETWETAARYCANHMGVKQLSGIEYVGTLTFRLEER